MTLSDMVRFLHTYNFQGPQSWKCCVVAMLWQFFILNKINFKMSVPWKWTVLTHWMVLKVLQQYFFIFFKNTLFSNLSNRDKHHCWVEKPLSHCFEKWTVDNRGFLRNPAPLSNDLFFKSCLKKTCFSMFFFLFF